MLTHIDRLFLDDLLATTVGRARSETVAAITSVASLLEEGLVHVSSPVFLLDDEIRWAAQVSILSVVALLLLIHQVRVLADVLQQLAPVVVLLRPLSHVVVWLLLLETLQDHLILPSDFHKFSLARLPIETLFEWKNSSAWHSSHAHAGHTLGGLRVVRVHHVHLGEMGVGMGDALGVLQDVGHLLEEDAVFTLNLRVPLCSKVQ